MRVNIEIEGLEQALRKLRMVEQRTSLNVIRAALRFAAKPTIELAKRLAPYNTGPNPDGYHIVDNIGLRAEKKKNRAGNATAMRFGAHRVTGGSDGYAIRGGLNKTPNAPNYANIVEKDTPFLMPAFESTENQIVRRFGDRIVERVTRL